MARLFIHIGWPKTGTTALQGFCAANAALLARHGLSYYASRGDCCGSVARTIAGGQPVQPLRRSFLDWLDAQGSRDVLISAEGFSGCDPGAVHAVFASDHWQSVEIIAHLRPQHGFLEGWYKQRVKWGGKMLLREYLQPGGEAWASGDYRAGLDAWAAWCAREGHLLRPRIYESGVLVGGTSVSDVFATIGRPDIPVDTARSNVSPSAALTRLYLRLPPIERLQQINRKMVASGHPAATGSGDLFGATTLGMIHAHYAAANEEIRRKYFPDRAALFASPKTATTPASDPAGLDQLLIETLARMRGPEIAAKARAALA